MGTVTAFSTVVFFGVFVGICCWAWSRGRQDANRESAMLPFALLDEATHDMHGVRDMHAACGRARRARTHEQEH